MGSRASEIFHIGGTIDPDATAASTVDSDYLDMREYEQAMAIGFAGTLGTSATLDFSIIQATDSSGTGAKAITGAAATQLTQAGTDSDKQVVITVKSEDLDMAGGFHFVALRAVVATATSDIGGVILGYRPFNSLTADLSTVDEIVNA